MMRFRKPAFLAVAACLGLMLLGCGETTTEPVSTPQPNLNLAPPPRPSEGEPKGGLQGMPEPTPPATETAEPKSETPSNPPAADTPPLEQPRQEGGDSAAVQLSEDELSEIRKLPEADQQLAMSQGICPVSEEHLGSMGVPRKVSAKGRSFFLCCEGCEKEVNDNPYGVIAKLDRK